MCLQGELSLRFQENLSKILSVLLGLVALLERVHIIGRMLDWMHLKGALLRLAKMSRAINTLNPNKTSTSWKITSI